MCVSEAISSRFCRLSHTNTWQINSQKKIAFHCYHIVTADPIRYVCAATVDIPAPSSYAKYHNKQDFLPLTSASEFFLFLVLYDYLVPLSALNTQAVRLM